MTIRSLYPVSRPSLDLNFAKTKRLDPRITFSRASTGAYFGSDGLIKSAAVNEARFDHDPRTGESLGLLVEEARTNLLLRSEQFDGADWTRTAVTVSPNTAIAPNNTFTANTVAVSTSGNYRYVLRNITLSQNTTYTLTVFLKYSSCQWAWLLGETSNDAFCWFDLINGVAGSATSGVTARISRILGDWFRCSITFTKSSATANEEIGFGLSDSNGSFAGTANLSVYAWGAQLEVGAFPTSYIPTPATFTSRASSATFYDANGTVQTAASGVARSAAFFPDSNGVMRPAGLLLEAAGTNLIVSSQVFNSGGWNLDGASLTANAAVAPDGTTTATSIVQGTGDNRIYHFDNNGSGNKTFTIFAKSNAGSSLVVTGNMAYGTNLVTTVTLNTADGTISGATGCSSSKLANGWYRFILPVFVSTGSGNSNYITINGPAASVYIWGAQLEASPYPTSYIPTTASTVTRSADVSSSATVTRSADVASITGTNFSSWYRQDEGSVLIRASSKAEQYLLEIPSSNGINYNVLAINSARAQFASVNSTTQASIFSPIGTWSLGVLNTASFAYKQDSFAVCSNGSVAATDTSGTVPAVALMDIGRRSNGNNYSCSTISRLTYWPTRLPDSILQSLTQ